MQNIALRCVILLIGLFGLLACNPAPATPTQTIRPAPTPTENEVGMPQIPREQSIIIGMTQYPDTFFEIESYSDASTQVLAMLQPACITSLEYEYQPVCFKKLPSFADGDAITKTIKIDNSYTGNIVINDYWFTNTAHLTETIYLEQMVVTWQLIDGMTWEDGTPVKASDFVFAAKVYNDPRIKNPSRFVLDHTEKYEALDDKTMTRLHSPQTKHSSVKNASRY